MTGTDAPDDAGSPLRITVVCTANRFRSPVVAAVIARAVEGLPACVDSMAASGPGGHPAVGEVVSLMADRGYDLSGHRSRACAPGLLADSDVVLVFEGQHAAAAIVEAGARRERVFLVRELLEVLPPGTGPGPRTPEAVRALADRIGTWRVGDAFEPRHQYADPMAGPRRAFPQAVGDLVDVAARCAARLWDLPEPPAPDHAQGRRRWFRWGAGT